MDTIRPATAFGPIEALLYGATPARSLMAALELGVFGHLAGGRRTARELAELTGTVPDRLEALADLLAAGGVLEKTAAGYANSPAADEYLVPGRPLYQGRAMALNMHFLASLDNGLAAALRDPEGTRGASDAAWAMQTIMDGTADHAKSGALYRVTRLVSGLPGFPDMQAMADVGGNHGDFTMALVDRNPGLCGVILDLPHVVPLSVERCRARGYGDRIAGRPFDLRADSPEAASFDLILASHVLYGVAGDLDAALGRLVRGLRPGGWLVSHHFARGQRDAVCEAGHELLTRLAGYPTHFLPREALVTAMGRHGLRDFRLEDPAAPLGGGLIVAARL